MIVTGILLSILGIALLCWLLFALAVQALPLFIGVFAGSLVFQNGAGAILAIVVGLVSAALALGITQFAFAKARTPYARVIIAVFVILPAAIAGYHATFGIARFAISAIEWRQALALIASFVVGCAAFARLNALVCR